MEGDRHLPTWEPPLHFALVCPGIYRCGAPLPENVPFLQSLNLKLIIFLSAESPNQTLKQFVANQSPRIVHLGLETWHAGESWRAVSEELVKRALELALNASQNSPCLFMGASGCHETGAVTACLRRLQRWNISTIFDEYRRFACSKARISIEHFIESFDLDLVTLPPIADRPAWLVEQFEAESDEYREFAARQIASSSASSVSTRVSQNGIIPQTGDYQSSVLFASVRGPFQPPPPLHDPHALVLHYGKSAPEKKKKKKDDAEAAVQLPVPQSSEHAYKSWYFDVGRAPLISERVTFSKKKSLVDDEED